MNKVLFDTNILLDVFLEREEHFEESATLLASVYQGQIIGYVTSQTYADMYYFLRKYLGASEARKGIQRVFTSFHTIAISEAIIKQSLDSEWKDFEDALQYYAALSSHVEYIITRNVKDFKRGDGVKVLDPTFFLQIMKI